jgi:hypothetical protein
VPGKVTQAEDQSVNADDQAAVDLAGRLWRFSLLC